MASSSRHRSPQPAQSIKSVNTSASINPRQQPVTLAKRLLFPALATNDLPPLLDSTSVPPELTAELYDFIALALRAFVNPWWTKITRYDKEFLPEITRILIVVVRSLESRVRAADLSPLIFQDLPTIITQHYQDYRNASSKLSTSYAGGGVMTIAQLFHQLQPHMAVTPDGRIEPEYLRQVVDHILKACLPKEDYDAEAERFIIREVILKVVLEDVVPKLSQPWFIQKVILDSLEPTDDPVSLHSQESTSTLSLAASAPPSPPFSFHNIAVLFLSAIQSISGFCLVLIHTYKQAVSAIKLVNQSTPKLKQYSPSSPIYPKSHLSERSHISPPPQEITQQILPPSPLSPPLSATSSTSSLFANQVSPNDNRPSDSTHVTPIARSDNYARGPLLMFTEIFSMQERLASNTIMTTTMVLTTYLTNFLDRLLPYMLDNTLSGQFITSIVRTAKRTLFPNGYPAPAPPDPTLEEQAIMRERLISWRPKGALVHILVLILGPDSPSTLAAALDPLTNVACNVHLIIFILDRIILALFPELGVYSEDTIADSTPR